MVLGSAFKVPWLSGLKVSGSGHHEVSGCELVNLLEAPGSAMLNPGYISFSQISS